MSFAIYLKAHGNTRVRGCLDRDASALLHQALRSRLFWTADWLSGKLFDDSTRVAAAVPTAVVAALRDVGRACTLPEEAQVFQYWWWLSVGAASDIGRVGIVVVLNRRPKHDTFKCLEID